MSDAYPPPQMPAKDFGPAQTSGKATFALVLGVLSLCFSFVASIPALILALMAMSEINSSQGKLKGTGLAVCGLVLAGIGTLSGCLMPALLLPAVHAAREAARRQVSANNLKQIGLAIHNYCDVYRERLPMAGSEDPQYGVGLSWRVRILPYLEQQPLYDQFHHDEPWDSPHNLAVAEQMPDIFRSPGHDDSGNTTVYLGVSSSPESLDANDRRAWTMFTTDPPFSARLRDCLDGTAYTIMVVEADSSESVPWTKPDDWEFDPRNAHRGLGNLRPKGFLALFCDGSVHFIPNDAGDDLVRILCDRSDGNRVELPSN